MSTQITEEVRDPNSGVLTAIRVVTFDDYGRRYFADVPVAPGAGAAAVSVGVSVEAVVAAVAAQVASVVAAKSAGPGQVLSVAQVKAIAKQNGSKRKDD